MSTTQKSVIVHLANQGKFVKAKKLCKILCKKSPNDPEAWFLYGSINGAIEDFHAAEFCCLKGIKLAPQNPTLRFNLGIALQKQGKYEKAIEHFKVSVKLLPQNAEAYLEIGNTYSLLDDVDEAIRYYKTTIQLNPQSAYAHHNLADLYLRRGDYSEAIKNFELAIEIQNDFVDAYCSLASAFISKSKYDRAIDLLEKSISRLPETTKLYFLLAIAYQEQGDTVNAAINYNKTLSLDNNHLDAQTGLAGILAVQGEYDTAGKELKKILEVQPDNFSALIAYITYAHQFGETETAISKGVECLNKHALPSVTKSKLIFALANLYEKQGKYDKAFEHYKKGNKLMAYYFDEDSYKTMFNSIKETYDSGLLNRLQLAGQHQTNPIFIVGMPRSGTSLVEQILASHSEVYGAGELPIINRMVDQLPRRLNTSKPYPECLDSIDSRTLEELANEYINQIRIKSDNSLYITDKMPLNAIHLGFISLLFPTAKIIHCKRDPRDICLSCYFKNFTGEHPYAYSLNSLGKFYRMYEDLMAHWMKTIKNPIMTINYENIVAEPEKYIRQLVDFCGLEWDDSCLKFYKTKRTVATASHSQVRQKMYSSSIGKWRIYEKHLDELFSALYSE